MSVIWKPVWLGLYPHAVLILTVSSREARGFTKAAWLSKKERNVVFKLLRYMSVQKLVFFSWIWECWRAQHVVDYGVHVENLISTPRGEPVHLKSQYFLKLSFEVFFINGPCIMYFTIALSLSSLGVQFRQADLLYLCLNLRIQSIWFFLSHLFVAHLWS